MIDRNASSAAELAANRGATTAIELAADKDASTAGELAAELMNHKMKVAEETVEGFGEKEDGDLATSSSPNKRSFDAIVKSEVGLGR